METNFFIRFSIGIALVLSSFVHCLAQPVHEAELKYTLIKPYTTTILKELADTSQFQITNAYADKTSGCTLVYAQQKLLGVSIFNTMLVLAFKQGKLVSKAGSFRTISQPGNGRVASLSVELLPAEAVKQAKRHILPSDLGSLRKAGKKRIVPFGELTAPGKAQPVRLEWVVTQAGSLRLTWRVRLESTSTLARYLVHVDARTGEVLNTLDLVKHCRLGHDVANRPSTNPKLIGIIATDLSISTLSKPIVSQPQPIQRDSANQSIVANATYQVVEFPAQSPLHPGGTPRPVKNPWERAGVNNPATQYGWHFDGETAHDSLKGNNAQAYFKNPITNIKSSLASSSPYPNLSFTTPFDFSKLPTTADNMAAGLTNLFYWANLNHDLFYQYGFDEVAGNTQYNNLGRGGVGLDPMKVNKTSGYFNGGDISTPPDGEAPEMNISIIKPSTAAIPGSKLEKIVSIQAPVSIQGLYEGREYDFVFDQPNLLVHTGPVSGRVTYYSDQGDSTHTACTAPANASVLQGSIALIDYSGACIDSIMFLHAQAAGAIGVLLVSPIAGPPPFIQSILPSLTIPVVIISQETGALLKQTLRISPVQLSLLNTASYYDGTLGNDVITHEYGHVISTRLSGGPATSTCLDNKETLSEGYSDFFAMMLNTDWSKANPNDGRLPFTLAGYSYLGDIDAGIRPYPFSTDMSINPRTYADVATAKSYTQVQGVPYTIGGPYISAMWDMIWGLNQREGINKNLYDANAKGGNSIGLKLVIMGAKLMPCGPGLLDGRDGILRADSLLYNCMYSDTIWTAFARRGMGLHACQGSPDSTGDERVAFDTPLFLKSLIVNHRGSKAQLAWTVYGKFQGYSFAVEKSTDSLHFTAIANLTALSNQTAYTYSDSVTDGELPYYRISYTNDLGQVHYSAIVRLVPLLPTDGLCLEAELTEGAGAVHSDIHASGGQYRTCYGNSDEHLLYTLHAPAEGNYAIRLWCSSVENPIAGIQVNEGQVQNLYIGNTSGQFVERSLNVSLKAGVNRIRVQGGPGGCFAQDKLCLESLSSARQSALASGQEATGLQLTIYPNPNMGQFKARFWATKDQPVHLLLLDLRGQIVLERSLKGEGGFQETTLDVPAGVGSFIILNLQAGIYSENQKVLLSP